jgi:hypothetical protein
VLNGKRGRNSIYRTYSIETTKAKDLYATSYLKMNMTYGTIAGVNAAMKQALEADVSPDVRSKMLGNLAYASSMSALMSTGFPVDDARIVTARKLYSQGDVNGANNTLDNCFSIVLPDSTVSNRFLDDTGFKPLASMGIYDPLEHSTKQGGCIGEAFELLRENDNRGAVLYVINMNGKPIGHAYYLENPSKPKEVARNQADNGFEGYPELTVEQVLKYGVRLQSESAKELTAILTARSQISLS